MGEPWKILGRETDPIWITGTIVADAGAGSTDVRLTGSTVVLTMTGAVEEYLPAVSTANSLSEYTTLWTAANQGFESASVVKASAGKLYEVLISNPSGVPVYLQFFNQTTLPSGGTLPSGSFRVEASGSLSIDFRTGRTFGTGIVLGMSTIYSAFSGTASGSFHAFYK